MTEQLIAPPFLFRFCVPCLSNKRAWSQEGVQLKKKHTVPNTQRAATVSRDVGRLVM